jgi:hypothetical protein
MQNTQLADAKLLAILKEIAPNRYEQEKRKAERESFSRQPFGISMCDSKKSGSAQPA